MLSNYSFYKFDMLYLIIHCTWFVRGLYVVCIKHTQIHTIENMRVSLLNLHLYLPKDVRKIIYAKLEENDIRLILNAHGSKKEPIPTLILSYHCARNGYLKLMKWVVARGFKWNVETCTCAAENGRLELLIWLHANNCPSSKMDVRYAAKNGHLEVMIWLHENVCRWDERTYAYAAKGGQLEILKYLRANMCPQDAKACALAAKNGNLEVLIWLRANGCPWDEDACANAVKNGHLEVLKWLRAYGCPFDLLKCKKYANENERHNVIDWLNTFL